MKFIDLLILIISLKVITTSSYECKNPNDKCIDLCCQMGDIYEEDIEECQEIPEYAESLWLALMQNMSKTEKVSFVENDECLLYPEQSVIDTCFSPYYERDADVYILKKYSKVPCERFSINSESSSKCKNPNGKCINLCCEIGQTYVENNEECLDIPEHARSQWFSLMRNVTKTEEMSFMENDECSLDPETSVIKECYSPKYSSDWKGFVYQQYANVSCDLDRPQKMTRGEILRAQGLALLMLVTSLCLPILIFFTCTKKDKKNELSYKLITWYLMSMIANKFLFAWGVFGYSKITPETSYYIYCLIDFFDISTLFWLSCIGYNVYMKFKESIVQSTDRRQDHIRFIWYTIFVFVATLTVFILDKVLTNISDLIDQGFYRVASILIAVFNVCAFVVLALKICVIRCRIIAISTEKHIKCKLVRVILRLFILMGIPRLLLLALRPVIGIQTATIMIYLEPYVIYGTFISEYDNCWTLFRCKCCCSRASLREETDGPTEEVTLSKVNTTV